MSLRKVVVVAALMVLAAAVFASAACGSDDEDAVDLTPTPEPGPTAPDELPEVDGETITTDSGLQYIEIEAGTGASPGPSDGVTVHYTGWLEADGTKFDSSLDVGTGDPVSFSLSGVIEGWTEGMQLMREGGKARLIVPPDLAYGEEGAGQGIIPPNATLIFDIELFEVYEGAPDSPPEVDGEVITTDSGLQYIVIEEGDGRSPSATDVVEVHYTGWLEADGTKFDSSRDRRDSIEFSLDGVIPGWTEGVQLMREGGMHRLIIPPDLGYGEAGGGTIPPNSTLIFDVELIAVR